MYCPNCGKEIDDNAKFCSYCGANLEEDNKKQTEKEENSNITKQDNNQAKKPNVYIIVIAILAIALIGAVVMLLSNNAGKGGKASKESAEETTTKSLDGSYFASIYDEYVTLDIENGNAILVYNGMTSKGKVDESTQRIEWDEDSGEDPSPYSAVNDKLVVSTSIGELTFEKGKAPEKDPEEEKYKYKGDGDSIDLGEYLIGSDIKPGSYEVSFSYYDFDADKEPENGEGTITFYKDGSKVKEIKMHEEDDDKNIVFEDGQTVVFSSKGKDSEFYISD